MNQEIEEINDVLKRFAAGDFTARLEVRGRGESFEQLSKNLNQLAELAKSSRESAAELENRASEINDVLFCMMAMDFSKTVPIGDGESPFDGIAAGINVLAEEYSFAIAEERKRTSELQAKAKIIAEQREAILELSTPILQIWDKIVVMPLIGVVDSLRAKQMLERLLNAVAETCARVVIIDVTGVPGFDTTIAQSLITAAQTTKLLGAETIITGISPQNAQMFAKQGFDFRTMATKGSLAAGLLFAFEVTDIKAME